MGIALGFFIGISISSTHLTKVIYIPIFLSVLHQAFIILLIPLSSFSCNILQISLLSSVGNSFDVPLAEIDRFSAEVGRSPAVIDESSGTKNLEALGSIRLPKVISLLML